MIYFDLILNYHCLYCKTVLLTFLLLFLLIRKSKLFLERGEGSVAIRNSQMSEGKPRSLSHTPTHRTIDSHIMYLDTDITTRIIYIISDYTHT